MANEEKPKLPQTSELSDSEHQLLEQRNTTKAVQDLETPLESIALNTHKTSEAIGELAKKMEPKEVEDNATFIIKGKKGDPGHTPTEAELLRLIKPLIPKPIPGKAGHTPTDQELLALIRPLIVKPKDGETPSDERILGLIKPILEKKLAEIPKPKELTGEELFKKLKPHLPEFPKTEKPKALTGEDVVALLKGKMSYEDLKDKPNLETFRGRTQASKTVSLTELDDVDYSGLSIVNGKYVLGSGGGSSSPLTTKGDIYVYGSTNTRLPVGTDGYALLADSTQPTGLRWAAALPGEGTVTNVASADGSLTVTNPTSTVDLSVVKAPKLSTARTIGGVSFDGTANITVASATGGFTVSGGDLAIGANNLTLTGSIGATGARATKLWATDGEFTNAPTVSGAAVYYSGGAKVSLADGGTGAGLTAPAANVLMGYDNTDSAVKFITIGSNLSYDHTTHTLSATAGGTGTVTSVGSADGSVTITNPTTTPDLSVVKAPKLTTARNINGVAFDGTANITVTAAAGTLTGSSLASGVTGSSLTSFGTNPAANNFLEGYTTTTTAAGTTTLTASDNYLQFFTGSTTQTVKMPAVSTLTLGQQYCIVNNSTGVVTVQSSGANTIQAMVASSIIFLTCIATSGTGTASWSWSYIPSMLSTNTASTLVLRDASGNFSAGTITAALTGNASTATSAGKWTNARTLAGNSVDGSANVAFANKFIVQGTADAGLSAAQFLGALGTGILKNTTTTGVLSIAVAGDFPTLNQNTTGSAATLTTARSIYGNSFNGSADLAQIIASTFGGTGNGFTKFSGPATAEKTFTLPNASATILTDNAAVTLAQGGTGQTALVTAATASTIVGQDANKNYSTNNVLEGFTTTATAAGTTTLTVGSTYQQFFTGSTTQTVTLPVATTLVNGQSWYIVNNSTGAVTIQTSGANTLLILAGSTAAIVTCINTAGGTGTASWSYYYFGDKITSGKSLSVSNILTLAGTDGTTMTFPTTSATLARTDAANTFTGHQTIEGVTSTGATGTGKFVFDTAPTIQTSLTMADAANIILGSTTGTKIGTATTQKLGFYNSAPITQPTGSIITALTNLGLVGSPTLSDSEISFTDITTNNSSSTKHGFLPKLSGNASDFFKGDGTWGAGAKALDIQTYTSTGANTWTKPASAQFVYVVMWGAGGGGGGSTGISQVGGGGGGGAYITAMFPASQLGATETVTVGTGGAGGVHAAGSAGGNTTFGSWLTAYGGGAGGISTGATTAGAGGGGGNKAAGGNGSGNSTGGAGGGYGGGAAGANDATGTYGGGGGGAGGAPGNAFYGGAGGSGTGSSPGGNSVFGGGGGGAAFYNGSIFITSNGGTSTNGGKGGNGVINANGQDGTQPGGGGGASGLSGAGSTNGGKGGDGKAIVITIF